MTINFDGENLQRWKKADLISALQMMENQFNALQHKAAITENAQTELNRTREQLYHFVEAHKRFVETMVDYEDIR